MNLLLNFYVCVGLCAVGSAFIVLLPTVGQTLSVVWTLIFAEQAFVIAAERCDLAGDLALVESRASLVGDGA